MRDLTPEAQTYSEQGLSVRGTTVLPRASTDAGGAARYGVGFLVLTLGGFLLWACLAPLDQGVVGSGTVVVAGERKAVQSLVGGVVEKLLVSDGERVTQGQLLVQLNTVQAQAQRDVTLGKLLNDRSVEARLIAERLGSAEIQWPVELLDRADEPRVKAAMALQSQSVSDPPCRTGQPFADHRTRSRGLAAAIARLRGRQAQLRRADALPAAGAGRPAQSGQ